MVEVAVLAPDRYPDCWRVGARVESDPSPPAVGNPDSPVGMLEFDAANPAVRALAERRRPGPCRVAAHRHEHVHFGVDEAVARR